MQLVKTDTSKMNIQKVTANILADKKITKAIEDNSYYSTEQFIADAQTYIKAIKGNRMLCIIKSVSSSGMSRKLKLNSFEGSKKGGYYRQYFSLLSTLGYKVDNKDAFTIHGCGMDMVFHTNYSIMHTFKRLGLITAKECEVLAQQTPTVL